MTRSVPFLAATLTVGLALHLLMLVSHAPPPSLAGAVTPDSLQRQGQTPGHDATHPAAIHEHEAIPTGVPAAPGRHDGHVLACLAIIALGLTSPHARSLLRGLALQMRASPSRPRVIERSHPPPRPPAASPLTPVAAHVVLLT
jgi:hypothetical protein